MAAKLLVRSVVKGAGSDAIEWRRRVRRAVEGVGTPCYVSAWSPVQCALDRISALDVPLPVRSWLSYKTHPLKELAAQWLRAGCGGVAVVSEAELACFLQLGYPTGRVLVNGVAKHTWLTRFELPRLRVHFDSIRELEALLPRALGQQWRVGVRIHPPDECDARDPPSGGQFGLTRDEAVRAIQILRAVGADLQSVHFHLGQQRHDPGAYARAVEYTATICDEAGLAPQYLDCGGGLPAPDDPQCEAALDDLAAAICIVPASLPSVEEIWLENGRFLTSGCTALAVRILDMKERDGYRYAICDGGRTNQALAADARPHAILTIPQRAGPMRLTTICGPTCMTDDRLGRWSLPQDLDVGDVIVWLDAGAYHLPSETRFSHGLCAIVWFDEEEHATVARRRELAKPRPSERLAWAQRHA